MRGGVFPGDLPEAEARERVHGRAAHGRPRPGPRGHARRAADPRRTDGPRVVAIDTGIKGSIVRNLRERGVRLELHPCTTQRRGAAGARARRGVPRQRPRRPGGARTTWWRACADCGQGAGAGASAWATSCSAGRWASRRSSCPSATAAPTTRSRTSRRGASTSPPRTTASRCSARAASARSTPTSRCAGTPTSARPSCTQLNLYDRTVEGLVLKDVPASTVQYHPEAGPGPHDSLYLFDRFLERCSGCRVGTTSRRSS